MARFVVDVTGEAIVTQSIEVVADDLDEAVLKAMELVDRRNWTVQALLRRPKIEHVEEVTDGVRNSTAQGTGVRGAVVGRKSDL